MLALLLALPPGAESKVVEENRDTNKCLVFFGMVLFV